MASNFDLSIVTTVYNDEAIVAPLVQEIVSVVSSMNIEYEIILVNDSSSDKSEDAIKNACDKNTCVKGISLSRNFGQQIAMSAGIAHSSGKYVLIMDGDLQNPPSEIPNFYSTITKNGRDIIYGVSKKRNNFWDEFTSNLFWYILTVIFKVKIVRNQLMMKIMTRKFIDRYNLYQEVSRTVSGILQDISANHEIIEIQNYPQIFGLYWI